MHVQQVQPYDHFPSGDYRDLVEIRFPKYRGDQYAGTLVRVDAGADPTKARKLLLKALGLTEHDLLWVAPGAGAPAAF